MTQVRDYVVQLEAHLAEVHRQSQRLIERQSKLGSSMSDFGASMVALGRFESGTLAQKFTKLGERADTLSGACQVSHRQTPWPFSTVDCCYRTCQCQLGHMTPHRYANVHCIAMQG